MFIVLLFIVIFNHMKFFKLEGVKKSICKVSTQPATKLHKSYIDPSLLSQLFTLLAIQQTIFNI